MEYHNKFKKLLEEVHKSEHNDEKYISHKLLEEIKHLIGMYEATWRSEIPIKEIVNSLESVYEKTIENKEEKDEAQPLDEYMTVNEAAKRFNIPAATIRNRLKPSIKNFTFQLEHMIDVGLVKYYLKPGGKRKEWIITEDAMRIWFSKKEV
ncbi:hypothetical protein [Bacillus luti]|uniref:hypothetical protein n=1 Tax=Bacillus luti TaxID=2026191 RepID=UPI00289C9DB2|nr:hypothetical protein [Bacillus luti]